MTFRHTAFVAAAVTAGLASVALAETPPQSDVSQINGQIVPVGDHHEYRYSFKRWNVSANPLGWIAGLYGVSASYGFHPNLALRVDANFYAPVGSGGNGFETSVGLPIYFRRTYQGAFLEPGFVVGQLADETDDTKAGPQVLVGWHWIWDSGFNIAVAAGVGRDLTRTHEYESEVFANGYVRFGYAF